MLDDKHLCGSCKYGMVLRGVDTRNIETFTFCNALTTPVKFQPEITVTECSRFKEGKPNG